MQIRGISPNIRGNRGEGGGTMPAGDDYHVGISQGRAGDARDLAGKRIANDGVGSAPPGRDVNAAIARLIEIGAFGR